MKFIITDFFQQQCKELSKKYSKFPADFSYFQEEFDLQLSIHLGEGVYKSRLKNSSIPTGKRGGFRIIVKVFGDNVLPLIIYAKSIQANVSDSEIITALEKVLEELS